MVSANELPALVPMTVIPLGAARDRQDMRAAGCSIVRTPGISMGQRYSSAILVALASIVCASCFWSVLKVILAGACPNTWKHNWPVFQPAFLVSFRSGLVGNGFTKHILCLVGVELFHSDFCRVVHSSLDSRKRRVFPTRITPSILARWIMASSSSSSQRSLLSPYLMQSRWCATHCLRLVKVCAFGGGHWLCGSCQRLRVQW